MSAARERRARDRRALWGIVLPISLWTLHFIAVYALDAAACAPRRLIDVDTARVATVLAAAATLVPLIGSAWHATRGREHGTLTTAAVWTAIISAIAIVVQTIPAVQFAGCG